MDASKMCVGTYAQGSIIWWVRVGSWTNVPLVTVVKAAKRLVLCRCARETQSARISLSTTVSAALNARMRMVGILMVR